MKSINEKLIFSHILILRSKVGKAVIGNQNLQEGVVGHWVLDWMGLFCGASLVIMHKIRECRTISGVRIDCRHCARSARCATSLKII